MFSRARALFANPTNNGALTANPSVQRNQYGGSIAGRVIKEKLFFFANAERIQQAQAASAGLGPLFAGANFGQQFATFGTPYEETYEVGPLDYNGPFGGHYFVRGAYNFNGSVSNFGNNDEAYKNRDNTYGVSGGGDFANGKFTHSVRGSYEKFHNLIADDTIGNNGVFNPNSFTHLPLCGAASIRRPSTAIYVRQCALRDRRQTEPGGGFPGNNPLLGPGAFVQPIGRSGYDALQVVYHQHQGAPRSAEFGLTPTF